MDLVTLAVACGLALRSPIFVTFQVQPDCTLSAATEPSSAPVGHEALVDRWLPEIAAAAQRFGIPERWVCAVMRAESGGIPSVTSPAGAMGLMQIMPATWVDLRRRYSLGADPYEPHDNILGGVAYLRELLDRYGSPNFLAAYNAGPARLDDHLLTGRPLPDETRRYVSLLRPQLVAEQMHGSAPAAELPSLGEIKAQESAAQMQADMPASSGLFAPIPSTLAAVDVHPVVPSGDRPSARHGAAELFGGGAEAGLSVTLHPVRSGS
ncbi:MAG: lytic transglycosylase domain-containing protein [Rhodopila sp.]|nr:lytic transglycosylase domain-containing protein [Rhodopila sp.]